MSFVIGGGSWCRFEVDVASSLIAFGPHNSEPKEDEHTGSQGNPSGEAGKIAGLKAALNPRGLWEWGRQLSLEKSSQCLFKFLFVLLHLKPITVVRKIEIHLLGCFNTHGF